MDNWGCDDFELRFCQMEIDSWELEKYKFVCEICYKEKNYNYRHYCRDLQADICSDCKEERENEKEEGEEGEE